MTDQKTHQLPDNFLSLFNNVQPQMQGVSTPQPQFVPQPPPVQPQPPQGAVQVPLSPQHQPAAPQAPQFPQAPAPQWTPNPVAPVVQPPAVPPQPQVPSSQNTPPAAAGQDLQLQNQNAQLQAELAQLRAQQKQAADKSKQDQIAALPKQDQILAQMEILKQGQATAVHRANEWQVAYEKEKIIGQFRGEIEEGRLDTSSIENLRASVGVARQAYQVRESEMFQKFAAQMGVQNQVAVEGLPPSPVAPQGFPTPNHAGAVPSLPAQALPQQNPMAHPQMGNSFPQPGAAGRVFQPGAPAPQPNAQGTYLQPQYYQQGQYPAQMMQPQAMAPQPVPNNAAAYQQMVQQQMMPQSAPTPDPGMRADGSAAGRNLSAGEQSSAVEAARSAIAANRRAGVTGARALGMYENSSNSMALSNTLGAQQPITHQNLPIPTAGDTQRSHPQYVAGARLA